MSSKVIIIIVTHNASKWLERCLNSVTNEPVVYKIIVVDNASTDQTTVIIKKFPQVESFLLGKNVGFGTANNIAIRHALDLDADYIFLLNQDAWVAPNTIKHLVEIARQNPQLGIVSPLHWNADGTKLDPEFLNYVTNGAPSMVADLLTHSVHTVYTVPFVAAAVWLITRQCIDRIGGFDPIFFMYREDDDYCRRALWHGFQVGITPSAHAYHVHGADSPAQKYWKAVSGRTNYLLSIFLFDLMRPDRSLFHNLLTVWAKSLSFAITALLSKDSVQLLSIVPAMAKGICKLKLVADHRQRSLTPGPTWL